MLNVHDLERKYKAYKLKNFLPYLVISLSLCVIFIVVLFVNSSDIFKSNKAHHNQKTFEVQLEQTKDAPIKGVDEKNETTKVAIEKKQETIEAKVDRGLILTPSLNFISSIKHSLPSNDVNYQKVINKNKIEKEIKTKKSKEKQVLKPAKKEPDSVVIEEVELQRSNPVKIHRQNTQDDINLVIRRFEKNNNPALSLFVAKKYYELENYNQSYNYALITNRINDNIDSSWIIFAKSLVKLDRKDEATKTLKRYIEHSKSTQAKTLLEEIERGKFR
ncbi:hypothetical protein M947_02250 [Sulfurimonas hongkongensis]|uniref:Transformation system protein n=1 Tax=Sulfurimonas hongkongensis TaxID=1172190 RepID=T0JRJ8_9BACT|nr:hypothetical protein [Sulfurimonas hongkongensis]EQB40651.1 hypothetical protein M947_02250 [Sulfurimonas hongkongensis]